MSSCTLNAGRDESQCCKGECKGQSKASRLDRECHLHPLTRSDYCSSLFSASCNRYPDRHAASSFCLAVPENRRQQNSMRERGGAWASCLVSLLLLACTATAAGSRVTSGLLSDLTQRDQELVEGFAVTAETASRTLQQAEPVAALTLSPASTPFVVSHGLPHGQTHVSRAKCMTGEEAACAESAHACTSTMVAMKLIRICVCLQNILQPVLQAAAVPGRPGEQPVSQMVI